VRWRYYVKYVAARSDAPSEERVKEESLGAGVIASTKVGLLSVAGALILGTALFLILVILLFMSSSSFDLGDYGILGLVETFALLLLGVVLGVLCLVWARECEKREIRVREQAFLESHLGSDFAGKSDPRGEGKIRLR
jgi:hypothetical protein